MKLLVIIELNIFYIVLNHIYSTAAQCINPNQNYGYCLSIYECPSIYYTLTKKPLTELDKRFVRESECRNGYGRPPLVCCTYDNGFYFNRGSTATNPPFFPPSPEKNTNLLPSSPQCGADSIGHKILSGINTELNEFPWMVLLEYKKVSGGKGLNCAGTLINNRFVLTAAHCVAAIALRKIGDLASVRLGEYDTSSDIDCTGRDCADPAVSVGIEKIISHENYLEDSVHRHNDIALLKLIRNVQYTEFIRPICLPHKVKTNPPKAGDQLVVAGWGRTVTSRRSSRKQKLSIPVADQKECTDKFNGRQVTIIESQICAGGIFNEDSCDGDSGGPLMRYYRNSWVLEGIVSFGIRCGYENWPAVYTRVANYEDWIKNKINLN